MNFFLKEYKWIVTILIAIPSSIVAYQGIHFKNMKSESLYYFPKFPQNISDYHLGNADCWTGSISVNRPDAFRCSSNNQIYDPCFKNPDEMNDVIACPGYPDDENPVYLKAMNKEYGNNPEENLDFKSPWYVIMPDGSECRVHTGTIEFVADRSLNYSCWNGNIDSLILPIRIKDDNLYMDCAIGNHISENCKIKTAWY